MRSFFDISTLVPNEKFLVLKTRYSVDTLLNTLANHNLPTRVYVLEKKPSLLENKTSLFIINGSSDKDVRLTLQVFPILYASIQEAIGAIREYNNNPTIHLLFKPFILVCKNIKEKNVSQSFFNSLSKNSISHLLEYDDKNDDVMESLPPSLKK